MGEPCDLGLFILFFLFSPSEWALPCDCSGRCEHRFECVHSGKCLSKKSSWASHLIFSTRQPVCRWGGLSYPAEGQTLNTRRSDVGSQRGGKKMFFRVAPLRGKTTHRRVSAVDRRGWGGAEKMVCLRWSWAEFSSPSVQGLLNVQNRPCWEK